MAGAIDRIYRRLVGMIARAVVTRLDDDGGRQVVQVSTGDGEARDELENFQPYGFSSHAKPGAEAVVVFLGGNRDHGIALVVDDRRYRLRNLAEGEVAIYDDGGNEVRLMRGGIVRVSASTRLEVVSPSLVLTGDLEVGGSVRAAQEVADGVGTLQAVRGFFNLHTHVENGDGGGVTDPPIPQLPT